ncbi:hypothetical protein G3I59_23510 [Amycolatopsis rubida]|uniref:Glycerophosphoryl diester phosphodiesterase n=1 Tax=Amycolatopsis rubida TaxID=112413 RepID=A0ABX0BVN3_9PSEU|nr:MULTISPECIES: hypothetical protein [Amycolatopsis]MYW93503.1 hypothetical protein [Amycolatopsis rubida]NEC58490.1 hypothetical protein [Amycolatopsis rubida]OAP25467.1 hypothetical protein A4R44_03851 [Amycolatopsis sp. M39]
MTVISPWSASGSVCSPVTRAKSGLLTVTPHAPIEDVAAVRDAGADRYVTDRRRLQCG